MYRDSITALSKTDRDISLAHGTLIALVTPVVTDIADNDYTDAGIELSEDDVTIADSCTKKYAIMLAIADPSEGNLDLVAPDKIVQVDETHKSVPLVAYYVFEDLTCSEDNLQYSAGWNVLTALYAFENGEYAAEPDSISLISVEDINDYLRLDAAADDSVECRGTGYAEMLAGLVLVASQTPMWLYVKPNGQWLPIGIERLQNAVSLLQEITNDLEDWSHQHLNMHVLNRITMDLLDDSHYHRNGAALNLFAGTSDTLQYNGKSVPLVDPDDVTLLGLGVYNSDLVIRDDVISGDSIQDVPVYIDGEVGDICRLIQTDNDETVAYVALSETRQPSTGMPLRFVKALVDGAYLFWYPSPLLDAQDNVVHPAGWSDEYGQTADSPSFLGFFPNLYIVGSEQYDDLTSDLPDKAASALRSLSQCINTSASAMGTIRYTYDAVERFAGRIVPNHKYMLTTPYSVSLDLPSVSWSQYDAGFVLYLTCTEHVDVIFPAGTLLTGDINTRKGYHKLIGSYIRDAGVWSVGCIDYAEPEVQS